MNVSGLLEADRVAIVEWAERHPEVVRVYLYGSRARGDHHAGSDIDLAIEILTQSGDSDSFTTWMYWKQDFDEAPDLQLSAEVQLEWYEKGAGLTRVGPGVEKDGIVLFERKT